MVLMREKGFKSISQLDEFIKESTLKRQNIQDQIKVIDNKISALSNTIEQVHTENFIAKSIWNIRKVRQTKLF